MIEMISKTLGFFVHRDMKMNAYRKIFLAGILLILFACSKNDYITENRPYFEIVKEPGYISSDTSVSPGTLMRFKVRAIESDYPLTNFFIEVETFDHQHYRLFDTAFYLPEFVWEGSFYKSAEVQQRMLFVIRDRQGNSNADVFTIYTDSSSSFNPIELMENIQLGAQNNMLVGGFFSLTSQNVYFLKEASTQQQAVDLVCYYGEDALTIASPGANIEPGIFPENLSPVNWSTRNTTRYIKTGLSDVNFEQAENDSIMIAHYVDADGKRKAKNLQEGDIYVFKNQQNRLGLFRVKQASGMNEGQVEIDIKVQKQEK